MSICGESIKVIIVITRTYSFMYHMCRCTCACALSHIVRRERVLLGTFVEKVCVCVCVCAHHTSATHPRHTHRTFITQSLTPHTTHITSHIYTHPYPTHTHTPHPTHTHIRSASQLSSKPSKKRPPK